jgi:hypothetical protein
MAFSSLVNLGYWFSNRELQILNLEFRILNLFWTFILSAESLVRGTVRTVNHTKRLKDRNVPIFISFPFNINSLGRKSLWLYRILYIYFPWIREIWRFVHARKVIFPESNARGKYNYFEGEQYDVLINVTWDCFDQSNFYIYRINIIEWNRLFSREQIFISPLFKGNKCIVSCISRSN